MNKKNIISTPKGLTGKLKTLNTKRKGIRREFTKEESKLSPESKKFIMLIKKRKGIRREFTKEESKLSPESKKLTGITKVRKGIRREFTKEESELSLQAKKLAVTTKEEEKRKKIIRSKLSVAEEELIIKAEQLIVTAKEKEDVRLKLETTAKALAVTAKDKEDIRKKLAVTAKEKEEVRQKLVVTAKELAETAREKEDIRLKLEITAEILAKTAEEKEDVRKKLEVTAEDLKEKAEALAVTAKEKEDIRLKLVDTAEEKESIRRKLEMTAEELKDKAEALAVTAKEKEITRKELVVTAEELKRSRETLEDKVLERTRNLASAKARNDAILASIGDGLVVVDKEGKILMVNNAFENLVGRKDKEVLGKLLVEVVPREDEAGNIVPFKERILTKILSSTSTSTSTSTTWYYIRKDKTRLPIASIITPLILEGKITGAVEVFRDITKEKEIDRMKTEFISLASHQLRTPLSAIKWFGEMLLAGDAGVLNKDQKEYINNISLSNNRMIDLVNSLLNISRIESGRIIIDPEPTDLGKLVQNVLAEINNKIKEKKQQVIISIHDKLPKINIDPKLIYEVYKNLLTNANKYTKVGGEISIFISKKDKEIISQISDNGYGISKKDQAKIFERFYRAENIVKLETEGTGLGLYLAKTIVESSSGKIWFKSQEKIGTTFWFTLPISGVKAKKGEVTINS